MDTLWPVTLGLSLSVCAGFRAILPLFLLALGHRLAPGWVPLGESFDWLASTPALGALAAAVIAEVLADKIPALDSVFDALQTPVRTCAGAFIVMAPFTDAPPWALAILALIGGAGAFATHGAKSTLRAASTVTTGGLANPIISLVEDLMVVVLAVLAMILAPLALLVLGLIVYRLFKKVRGLVARDVESTEQTARDPEAATSPDAAP